MVTFWWGHFWWGEAPERQNHSCEGLDVQAYDRFVTPKDAPSRGPAYHLGWARLLA